MYKCEFLPLLEICILYVFQGLHMPAINVIYFWENSLQFYNGTRFIVFYKSKYTHQKFSGCNPPVIKTKHVIEAIQFHARECNIWASCYRLFIILLCYTVDRLCGLVVRVSGYRSRGPGIDSRRFQIFWEAVGLELGPLSLVRTTEELLGRNSSGSGQQNRDWRPGGSVALTTQHPLSAKVGTTSPRSGGRSVGIVRSRT
jgi:hypothetical protein